MNAIKLSTAPVGAGSAQHRAHAAIILTLLAAGAPVTIEAMGHAAYVDGVRPAHWAASLRSTINGLRRSQARHGAVILKGRQGYRMLTGESAPIVLPGRFRRFRGFVPTATTRQAT